MIPPGVVRIERILDVSTIHISKEDADLLAMAADPSCDCVDGLPIAYQYEYGFFVYVYDDVNDLEDAKQRFLEEGMSQEFVNLLDIARLYDCKYLQLDSDGAVYDELRKFDW